MKKSFLFFVFILLCSRCYSQSGSLTVTNNASCDINVTMYASTADCYGSTYCQMYISNTFTVPGSGTTLTWCTPQNFGWGSGGCATTSVGWATSACTFSTWSPSDFYRDEAIITYAHGCTTPMSCSTSYTSTIDLKPQGQQMYGSLFYKLG
jgi:hypothetical protein